MLEPNPALHNPANFSTSNSSLLRTSKKEKDNSFPFINFVRFISMICIVWAHTDVFPPFNANNGVEYDQTSFIQATNNPELYIFFKHIFKFSVICFFMISGFLAGGKLDMPAREFIRNRLNSTLKPYLIALSLTIFMICFGHFVLKHSPFSFKYIIEKYLAVILETSYWFLPNYLFCLIVIFLFKKFVDKPWFGSILLLLTIINTIIFCYIPKFYANHSIALTGFLFYVWLGIFVRRKNLHLVIKKISLWKLSLALILMCAISYFEVLRIFYVDHDHIFNTLRLSNQIYSLIVFVFLIRICPEKPNFWIFNPRKESYGVYLYFFPVLAFVIPVIQSLVEKIFHIQIYSFDTSLMLLLSFVKLIICYFLVILFIKINYRFKLGLVL